MCDIASRGADSMAVFIWGNLRELSICPPSTSGGQVDFPLFFFLFFHIYPINVIKLEYRSVCHFLAGYKR